MTAADLRGKSETVQPLTVAFTVALGEIWTDADGIQWRVVSTDHLGGGIDLERTVATTVRDPHEFVKHWRKESELICDGEFAGPSACVCGHPERHA